jgi:hypothetical protein
MLKSYILSKGFLIFLAIVAVAVVVLVFTSSKADAKYGCSSGACIEMPDGFYDESTCRKQCDVPQLFYGCEADGTCVLKTNNVDGPFNTSDCQQKCTPGPKYKCVAAKCVEVPAGKGDFKDSECRSSCVVPKEYNGLTTDSVFQCDQLNCLSFKHSSEQNITKQSFENTSDMVEKVANNFSISGSGLILGAILKGTLDVATGYKTETTLDIKSAYLDVQVLSGTITLVQNEKCNALTQLSADLVANFSKLPVFIANPELPANWNDYFNFFNKFGSHVITQIVYGSRYMFWESSRETSTDTSKNLEIKACLSVNGETAATCNDYTKDQITKAKAMSSNSYKVVLGGSDATKNALINPPTGSDPYKILQDFLATAAQSQEPIDYKFTPLWELIARFVQGNCNEQERSSCENIQRCINLEAAFALSAFSCPLMQSPNGVVYQQFKVDELRKPANGLRTYACWAKKAGCSSGSDCGYSASHAGCQAGGNSTFDAGEFIGDPAKNIQRTAIHYSRNGSIWSGVNMSCHQSGGCKCNSSWNGGLQDRSLWQNAFF